MCQSDAPTALETFQEAFLASPPQSPPARPIPAPRTNADPVPIPVHEAPRSPMHPHYDIPPDNWIPYAGKGDDVSSIMLPPPHEFSRPVSPVDPSPARSEAPLPPLPPQTPPIPIPPRAETSRSDPSTRYATSVRSRDFAYGGAPVAYKPPPPPSVMRSPQSKTSTRISEFDLVAPPKFERIYRQGVDRESISSGRRRIYDPPVSPILVK